jgi:hypothetical protein
MAGVLAEIRTGQDGSWSLRSWTQSAGLVFWQNRSGSISNAVQKRYHLLSYVPIIDRNEDYNWPLVIFLTRVEVTNAWKHVP